MRKLDEIANEKFNGNVQETIKYLMLNSGPQGFDPYVDELTQEEASFVVDLLHSEAIQIYGSEKRYKEEIVKNTALTTFGVTEEEVLKAPKNPYKASVLKNFLKMFLAEGGILALGAAGLNPEILGLAGSVVTGLCAMTIASDMVNYFKYKKMVNLVQKHSHEELDASSKGRGL